MATPNTAQATLPLTQKSSGHKLWIQIKRHIPLYIMALPGLIYLFINNYMPMGGLTIAFKNINYRDGIWASPWCGLDNFEFLFKTKDAITMITNTISYNLVFIILNTFLSLMLAIFLNEVGHKFFKSFFQSALLLPHLISTVVIAYLAYAFLSPSTGVINKSLLEPLGIDGIDWYMTPKYWPFILVFVNAWKNVGYNCIVYFASIVGIDKSLYEAAELDGASRWQQIWKITVPIIMPTIMIMTLMSIGRIFRSDFGLFYQLPMNSGPLIDITQTLDTYVYRALLERGDIGMSSAAGFVQSIVGFVLVVISNNLAKRKDADGSLF